MLGVLPRPAERGEGWGEGAPHPNETAAGILRPVPAVRGARARAAPPLLKSSYLTIPNSRSRSRGAFSAPGFCFFASRTPIEGWRSAESRTGACEAPGGPARNAAGQALARRLASHNAGRPPLGAHTVAIFGSGAALASPDLRPARCQLLPSGSSCPPRCFPYL